jgi:predicted ATPase/class 3 adenylate cyclase
VRRDLPAGTVTFLFTDIEGSTKLLHELGAEAYAEALAEHRSLLREAFARHGGVEVDTQGDAFFYAFPTAPGAITAAREGRDALSSGPIRVRMGLHTGRPHLTAEGYVGADVHKGARIAAAGHGGQILLSIETRDSAGVQVEDLGEHRLKDFADPVWIFQLGAERHPPLKTISNTNLPRPASSFVGREREIAEVVSLLRDGARLVTLTGPGGSGKTRLAIEAATELVPEHRNGVFWIGLATLRDAALVLDTISQTLGSKDALAGFIADREMLLLLDNFEQVVDAAPELPSLLSACPNLRVIVTSRELLRVQGEVEYPVPPLARSDAVDLFCTRSRLGADATIAELCRRLDDLPLAVELAAARTSVLSPQEILARLSSRLDLLKGGRDADARQATLRATIEWSFDLLANEERELFARLAIFSAGCTLSSATEVADADLDALQSLVDKSLIRHTAERFWMLETIREFAIERLAELEESDALRRRHAAHFLALAEESEVELLAGRTDKWLGRLEEELDNFRSALDTLETEGAAEDVLRLLGALAQFLGQKAHFVEAMRRFERALAADHRPTPARAKALDGASWMASGLNDLDACRRYAEEALTLHRKIGNAWGAAQSEWTMGYVAVEKGDLDSAGPLLSSAIRVFRETGDEHSGLLATRTLVYLFMRRADLEGARALNAEALDRARALGDRAVEAVLLGQLVAIETDQGKFTEALTVLKEQLPIHREVGDVLEQVADLVRVATVLSDAGRAEEALVLASGIESLREELGALWAWAVKENASTIEAARRVLPPRAFAGAWEKGRTLTLDAAYTLALSALG